MHQIWDKVFKVIADRYPNQVVQYAASDKKYRVCGKYEQERVSLEFQIADVNYWIEDTDGTRKILNIEPYSGWENKIPAWVFTRNAIITKSMDYKFDVLSVVILLENRKEQDYYHSVELGNEVINCFQFPVKSFADPDEILERYKALSPFILKTDRREYETRVLEAIQDDPVLKYLTVLVLNHIGYTIKEAMLMTDTQLQEFRDTIFQIPIMREALKPLEYKWEQESKKRTLEWEKKSQEWEKRSQEWEKRSQELEKKSQELEKKSQELEKKSQEELKNKTQEAQEAQRKIQNDLDTVLRQKDEELKQSDEERDRIQNKFIEMIQESIKEMLEDKYGEKGIELYSLKSKQIEKISETALLTKLKRKIRELNTIEETEMYINFAID